MQTISNPLLDNEVDIVSDVERLTAKATITRRKREHKRELRDQRRIETAQEAIEDFDHDTSIYGFTKGQFSLIQLITATLERIGPSDFTISTWTAAHADVTDVLRFCNSGLIRSARWIVDLTFTKRTPELAHRIRETFGDDAIRVAKNHAKFALLGNDEWKVVIHTSMNLNHNPRFENFEIADDPELYAFHQTINDEIWNKQKRSVDKMRPYEIEKRFRKDI